ncbi:MAG: four helix bundle protein [Bacilli bacterium]
MNNFKELDIWKLSVELMHEIYTITKRFPQEEMYGLTNQIRRAIISVSSNIAEGSGRRSNKDFKHFLYMSLAVLRKWNVN